MKPASEKQKRARRGHACTLTSLHRSCGWAEIVTIEGVELQLCQRHQQRLEGIVRDAKQEKKERHPKQRRAA